MKKLNHGLEDSLLGLDQALDDDADGWKVLFESVRRLLSATILRHMPRDAYVEAEDVLQDVFVTLLTNERRALRNLQHRSFPEQYSYLIDIAVSRCNDYGRNCKKSAKVFSRDDPEPAIESYERPDTGFHDKLIYEMRWTVFPLLLERLPSAQAEVLKLRCSGSRGREIADKIGIPQNTVYSHINRGTAALKSLASELFPELCGGGELLDRFLEAK
jgi:RNA polymerase sigma factor (sigma-70 family)